MGRTVFVVARQHGELYQYLRERFASDIAVEVVLDRRLTQRRQRQLCPEIERRHGDRRCRPEADVELQSRSHAIITMS
jgi:hypothetical protein